VFHVSIWGAWSFAWGLSPHGDVTEQTGQKLKKVQIIAYYFFLQAFMNECSSCYYCS